MRTGVFVAFAVALVVMFGLMVPIEGGSFTLPPRGVPPTHPEGPRCLRLSYEQVPEPYEELPATVRLLPERAPESFWPSQVGLRAQLGPDVVRFPFAVWRYVGADSVDIRWYGSPILRLPIRGDNLVGRGGRPTYPSLYSALFDRGFRVRAVEQACMP